LGAAYTWTGLQKHKGVSYQPHRDDMAIKQLLLNPVNQSIIVGLEPGDRLAVDGDTGIKDVIGSTDRTIRNSRFAIRNCCAFTYKMTKL
jgi:hypothetical protein